MVGSDKYLMMRMWKPPIHTHHPPLIPITQNESINSTIMVSLQKVLLIFRQTNAKISLDQATIDIQSAFLYLWYISTCHLLREVCIPSLIITS